MGFTFHFLSHHQISSVPSTNPKPIPPSIPKPIFQNQPIQPLNFSHSPLKSQTQNPNDFNFKPIGSDSNGDGGGGVEAPKKYRDGGGDGGGDRDELWWFIWRWGKFLLLGSDRDNATGVVGSLAWTWVEVTYRLCLEVWEGFAFLIELGLYGCLGAVVLVLFGLIVVSHHLFENLFVSQDADSSSVV